MPSRSSIEVAWARRCRGLLRLAENNAEALAIGADPWDFAVSTEVLRLTGGLTHADLHWLRTRTDENGENGDTHPFRQSSNHAVRGVALGRTREKEQGRYAMALR